MNLTPDWSAAAVVVAVAVSYIARDWMGWWHLRQLNIMRTRC